MGECLQGGWRSRTAVSRSPQDRSRNDIADALLLLQHSEKENDPQKGHMIGHSNTPAKNAAHLRSIN
jgi:hypothetical protein